MEEAIRFAGYPLKDFFEHPAVQVIEIKSNQEDPDTIEIAFKVLAEKFQLGPKPIRVKSGTLRLSRSKNYLLVGYAMQLPQGSYQVEFFDFEVGIVLSTLPQKITTKKGSEVVAVQNCDLEFGSIGRSEFRLPAFGLTEPPGFNAGFLSFYSWIFMVLAVIAMIVLFLSKRRWNKK